jgi:hypothetical protein
LNKSASTFAKARPLGRFDSSFFAESQEVQNLRLIECRGLALANVDEDLDRFTRPSGTNEEFGVFGMNLFGAPRKGGDEYETSYRINHCTSEKKHS